MHLYFGSQAEVIAFAGRDMTADLILISLDDSTLVMRGIGGILTGQPKRVLRRARFFLLWFDGKEAIDMHTSITVGQVLKSKGPEYWFVAPSTTVYEALEAMAEKNVGALLVVEGGKLLGIFSERDYARKVILKGKSSKSTVVRDLMTSPPICIGPEKSIHECMVLMTKNHIRHVPVVDHRGLLGVVSIGDVVNSIISDQEATIEELESYITVGY
jgi:CBS domain-containing protein